MKRWFKNSLFTLGAMFILSAVAMGIGVAAGEKSFLYDPMLGVIVAMMCVSPLPIIIAIVTGIGTLIESTTGSGKQKRKNMGSGIHDDYQLQQIMNSLTPEQQIYLEERLRNSRLGVGNDGEIISMDDLFDDDSSQQNWMK